VRACPSNIEKVSAWPDSLEKIRGTVGVWSWAHESLAPERSGEIAVELEALGYLALWCPEAWGREAFTNASLLLSKTTSLVLATGIANIWGRDAVTAANAAKPSPPPTTSASYWAWESLTSPWYKVCVATSTRRPLRP